MLRQRDELSLRVMMAWENYQKAFRSANIYVQVLIIFAVSRVFGWVLFTVVGKQEKYSPWSDQPMDYLSFVNIWDADWYRKIAETGYPTQLPLTPTGTVAENPWAFYPLYPLVNSALMNLLGVSYPPVAAAVSLVSGFGAACLIYRLFETSLRTLRAGRVLAVLSEPSRIESMALWGVAVFSFAPISPVLQVAYAESLNLLFVAAVLLALMNRRFWWAVLLAIPACFSRPVGVPLGATAGLLWLIAWIIDARGMHTGADQPGAPLGWSKSFAQHTSQLISALLICGIALLWPLIAWIRTGRVDAYTATETAWRGSDLYLVAPWFRQSTEYFGAAGPILFIVLLIGFIVLLSSRLTRRTLHPVLIMWCACYAAYLVLFLNPQSSLFRMLLPLFPLALVTVAVSADRAYRVLLVLGGAALQFGWVGWLWHWKQLPTGGDYPP
ncbi:hypothetical protein [uncultured Rothia sp.]|uniref:hypothetical protein n=1 Tax=uncultured Rothia sp. TaxID=316088 RepID=UPI0032163F15